MKKYYSILTATLLFAFSCIITFSCCKKKCSDPSNPDCGNYDPCYGAAHVTADFIVTENLQADNIGAPSFGDTLPYRNYNDDSIIGRRAIFTPKYPDMPNTKYTWYIGADTFHTRVVYLGFSAAKVGDVIPIKLVINAKPNSTCYPNDDSVLSLIKNIVIARTPNYMFGSWQGYFVDSPSIIKTFTLRDSMDGPNPYYQIKGLYPIDSWILQPHGITRREFYYDYNYLPTVGKGTYIYGTMLVDSTFNKITIYNMYENGLDPFSFRTFIGHRL